MKNYSLVLFDIDGTLVNTSSVVFESFNYIFKKYNQPEVSFDHFITFFGRHPKKVFQELKYDIPNPDKAAVEFFDYQLENGDRMQLYPHVFDTLQKLLLIGKKVGIYTNANRKKTMTILEKVIKITPTNYCIIVTGDDVANPKPHPEGLLKCASEMKTSLTDAIYVGDSIADILAAQAAPMDSLLLTNGEDKSYIQVKPTYTVKYLDGLFDILPQD